MDTPSDASLVARWEHTLVAGTQERAVALLRSFGGEPSPGELSVGRRDGALLDLFERAFGPALEGVAACPACGAELELRFSAADVRAATSSEPGLINAGEYEVRVRLLEVGDLLAAGGAADVEDARSFLLERCVVSARRDGAEVAAAELPCDVVAEVERVLEESDPQADVRIALGCPDCAHRWSPVFEPAAFFAAEVDAAAERIFDDVHTLAVRYGWAEADILAMSASRRERYLRMALA